MNHFDNLNNDVNSIIAQHLDFSGLRALSGVDHYKNTFFREHRNTRAIDFLNAINTSDWTRVESMLNADASLRNFKAPMTDRNGVEHPSCTPLQLIVLNAYGQAQFNQAAHIVGQLLNGMQEEDLKGQLSALAAQGETKRNMVAQAAAMGGHRAYAEELRTQHPADINLIAKGAARGGHRDYAEELRTQGADTDCIATGAARGGHRDYAEELRTQHGADIDWIARGAAEGGHRDYAEELRTQHGADIDLIAEGAALGGHRDYAEELRTQHGADINWIARGAAKGGHRDYADFLRAIIAGEQVNQATGQAAGSNL